MIHPMNALRATLPVLLIVLAPLGMLHTLWVNPTSAGEDDVIYYYPIRERVGRAVREGRWPIENPREATGMPLMADPQSAVMYPPAWLFAVMPAKRAYALTLLGAFSLAGAGAYLYLRRLGLIRAAACFGAVAFMFCGFLVGHRVHWSVLHAGAYLPWGLWCIEGLRRRPGAAFAWMVPVGYLAVTAGHWPTLVHMGLVWSAYLLLRARPLGRSLALAAAGMVLAVALAGPQIDATRRLLAEASRDGIGYATAGENSFFPASAVLAVYPMLLGCRTPNFFPAEWWGPWHLCETLGYVGLATLVLAGAAVWTMYRRKRPEGTAAAEDVPLRPLVRVWTWLGIAAGIWMLGYYLPTYRLIHMLPVLGMVRCPARMVLAADMALATLAAIAIHAAAGEGVAERLRGCIRRGAARVLPIAMVATLLALAAAGGIAVAFFGGEIMFFDCGGAGWRALKAVLPTNPAVWVQAVLAAATIAAVLAWLKAPRRRAGLLVAMLLADLFLVTGFVDVPADLARAPDPERSPAGALLAERAPDREEYLVWGIDESYHDRAAELLRPKTAHSLGFGTINTYGPFQSPAHAQLLGFRIFGTNRDWARLVRRNYLLSGYGVRFLLAARKDVREVVESVRVPDGPAPPDGPDLLGGDWWLDLAESIGGTLRLRTPVLWRWSIAKQPLTLEAETVYRISLDARGPDGGAANFLRAEIHQQGWELAYAETEKLGLTAFAEQIGAEWRHFEWTFRTPPGLKGKVLFRLFTMSERPIEVRNVRLRTAGWDRPIGAAGRLAPGQAVYERIAELPAERHGDAPVAVYENRLWRPRTGGRALAKRTDRQIEQIKWPGVAGAPVPGELPRIGLEVRHDPARVFWRTTVPAAMAYVLALAGLAAAGGRRRRRSEVSPSGGAMIQ